MTGTASAKTIAIGSVAKGFGLKSAIHTRLTNQGHRVLDMGCFGMDRTASGRFRPFFSSETARKLRALPGSGRRPPTQLCWTAFRRMQWNPRMAA